MVRVRFAPSPTGSLHIGGARTALFNYLFARSNQGQFILRIEDTDLDRSQKIFVREITESLNWLGIKWDEGPEKEGEAGPYFQSQRRNIYQRYLKKLIDCKRVYPCFCHDEILLQKKEAKQKKSQPYIYDRTCYQLDRREVEKRISRKEKFVYRFFTPNQLITLDDQVKGKINFSSELLGDFILTKSNGSSTYNFANVVDDIEMGITHVIRGDDHLTNTFKQILIFLSLQKKCPVFAHISLIVSETKEKLSKRHGAVSVLEFKKLGYFSDPLVNHLALLGWSPVDGEEVISRKKLEESFNTLSFSKSPAIFDYNRLNYLNGLYLRNLPDQEVLDQFKAVLTQKKKDLSHIKIDEILLNFKNQCKTVNDIVVYYDNFFTSYSVSSNQEQKKLNLKENNLLFQMAYDLFSRKKEKFIQPEEFKQLIDLAKKKNIKGKNFFIPLRMKLTNQSSGLELNRFIFLNYRYVILKRLK